MLIIMVQHWPSIKRTTGRGYSESAEILSKVHTNFGPDRAEFLIYMKIYSTVISDSYWLFILAVLATMNTCVYSQSVR